MAFKVGDKVKFLNEVGGGTVISVIDHKMVKLETDDGFEMPVLTINLIPDYRNNPQVEPEKRKSALELLNEPVVPEKSAISEINPWGTIKEMPGVYLAYEPQEQQWLLTGNIDVVLINHTGYELLYSLFLQQTETLQGVDFGSVPAHSKIVIESISRDDIEKWNVGAIQMLFHADEPKKIYMPVHISLDIKANRFYKEGSFIANSLLQGKALMVNLVSQMALTVASDQEAVKKYNSDIASQQSKVQKDRPFIAKYKTVVGEATVDLHIAELVDNISGMSSHDMFTLQMDVFNKALYSGMENDYEKIIFIHGVGNGVLKNAIIKALDNFEGVKNSMASISKFGVGAIDVIIKNTGA